MKVKNVYIILLLLFFLLLIFFLTTNYLLIANFLETLFFKILAYKDYDYFKFILILSLFNLIYFLTPLPIIFIIVFNGFIFGIFGFLFSLFFILIGSILIFLFSKNILKKNILKLRIFKFIKLKAQKVQFIKKSSNGIIFLSRYIFPYFLHNIIFGLYEIRLIRFSIIIFLAEIPTTLALNNIGKSLNNFVLVNDYRIFDLFFDYQFLIPFIFIFSVILIASSVEKVIVKKKNN